MVHLYQYTVYTLSVLLEDHPYSSTLGAILGYSFYHAIASI